MHEHHIRYDGPQQPEKINEQCLRWRWPCPAYKTVNDKRTEHTQDERTQLVRFLCASIYQEELITDGPTHEPSPYEQAPHAQRFQIDHGGHRHCESCNPGMTPLGEAADIAEGPQRCPHPHGTRFPDCVCKTLATHRGHPEAKRQDDGVTRPAQ